MELVPHADPVLRQVSTPYEDFESGASVQLAKDLEEAMLRFDGIGLSAVQVGIPVRAFAMRTEKPNLVVFNPKIVDVSEETVALDEGCLTFPGLVVKVTRPRIIKARFTVASGDVLTLKFDGMTARCFQHEMDHLDGVLFHDHVGPLKLALDVKRAAKRGYRYNPVALRNVRREHV